MASERSGDAAFFAQGKIVALPDVVEGEQLDHQMMRRVAASFDEGNGVMARIGVKEIRVEGTPHVIGKMKSEHVTIEWQRVIDVLDVQHHVAHAERPGAEPRDRATGFEGLARALRAVEDFKPVPERIGEHDEIFHPTFVRKRARSA